MKFAIVERRKHKRIWDKDFRRIIIGIGSIFFIAIVSLALNFTQVSNIIFGVACMFGAAVYIHYSNNIFSYVHYYDVVGEIDFKEDTIRINDDVFGYENIRQIKIFIGFYKNYQKSRYSNLYDGINRIECYIKEEHFTYAFVIHSREEYINFERGLMNLQSRYTIKLLDSFRRDNVRLPVLSK
jgi:hypothetical protein